MMSLCKTVHTFLGFSDSGDRRNQQHRCRNIHAPGGGGLRFFAGDLPKPPNVVESSAVGSPRRKPERVDPGARGLYDQDDDGLGLCTEGLGFESCGVRMATEEEDEMGRRGRRTEEEKEVRGSRKIRSRRRRAEAKFPPPLQWLAGGNGRRSFYMKADRKDGRFLLTEVSIERPEILLASRHDGRLRLQLIRSDLEAVVDEVEEEDGGGEIGRIEEEEEEEEEMKAGRWELSVKSEGFRRCQEAVSDRHLPLWSNHRFVTTA